MEEGTSVAAELYTVRLYCPGRKIVGILGKMFLMRNWSVL